MQKPFWKIQQKTNQKKIIKQFVELIDNASNLKIKYVVLPLVDNGSLKNIYQKKELIMILKNLTNYIRSKKIMILFEFDSSPKFIRIFLKNLDTKVFGINYDTGNSASYGYNVDIEFRAYSKLIKNIHLKDKNIDGISVALGEGIVNFNKFFKNLLKYKYDGNLILQTARSKNRMHVQEIKKNIKFISQYLK
jgi:hexulose-6-phosphate isomerase